jgi:hypothetical protein
MNFHVVAGLYAEIELSLNCLRKRSLNSRWPWTTNHPGWKKQAEIYDNRIYGEKQLQMAADAHIRLT